MTNKYRYKNLFDELVDNYFSNEKFIQQREALENENLDDEYKKYVLEKFKSRTHEGWFKFIANRERTISIVNIKKGKLPPEVEVENLRRLDGSKFEGSQPGIETKLNLEVFRELYIEDKAEVKENESHHEKLMDIKIVKNGAAELDLSESSTSGKIPSKGLKSLAQKACEQLIKKGVITTIIEETKANKEISSLIIPELEKRYDVTTANKKSISDYFRKRIIEITKDKQGNLIIKNHPR